MNSTSAFIKRPTVATGDAVPAALVLGAFALAEAAVSTPEGEALGRAQDR